MTSIVGVEGIRIIDEAGYLPMEMRRMLKRNPTFHRYQFQLFINYSIASRKSN